LIYIPVIALIIGVVIGFIVKFPVPAHVGVYMGVAVVAGLDSVFGGLRSAIEGKFRNDVFVTGFVANILIAFFLAWFGDRIGVNVYFVAILVMGARIFTNLSLIRRQMLTKWHDLRERKRLDEEVKAQQGDGESKTQHTVAT